MDLAHSVARLCLDHFRCLPKTGKPKQNEWTVLSCIVLEDCANFQVVALGTGSKCIGIDKMSPDGDILNDSHAEVICRRAFLRYLYEAMLRGSKLLAFDPDKQSFSIKSTAKFHFFTTHVPCGDAAVFPHQDADDFGDLISDYSVPAKKIKLDVCQTGAKCLPSDARQDLSCDGAIHHVTGAVRTKPGRGSPTASVSCSDKLAKWCHLGVQGALLSILLNKPLYFNSLIVAGGTPYNEEAMKRALFARLQGVHHKTELLLQQADITFVHAKCNDKTPSPASIVWVAINDQRQLEVAVEGRRQGVTRKRLKTAGRLKICKSELFNYFIKVLEQFKIQTDHFNFQNLNRLSYKQMKMCAIEYQTSWSRLKKCFKIWTAKDNDLLQFYNQ